MDLQQFGSFLQTRRKELMMTQSDLAQKIHVTDKAISRWERGVGFPDIRLLEPLADALELSLTELMQCRRLENPLPEEETIVLEEKTAQLMEEQEKLSWQRKLVLHLGQVVILAAAYVLVHISHQSALSFELGYMAYAIALIGTFFGSLAWRFIVAKLYLQSKPWGVWEKPYMWICKVMQTAGILLMVYSNRRGVKSGNMMLTVIAGALILGGCLYEKIQEEKEKET